MSLVETSVQRALHRGVDLHAPYGTPVLASFDGIIIGGGYDDASGHYVVIAGKTPSGEYPDPRWWFVPETLATEGTAGKDDSGWRAYYLHLAPPTAGAPMNGASQLGGGVAPPYQLPQKGTIVKRGQLIAYSGNSGLNPRTGQSYEPHLHFTLEYVTDGFIDDRVFVNPVSPTEGPITPEVLSGRRMVAQLPTGAMTQQGNAVIVRRDAEGKWTRDERGTVVLNNNNGVLSVNLGQGVSIASQADVKTKLGFIPEVP